MRPCRLQYRLKVRLVRSRALPRLDSRGGCLYMSSSHGALERRLHLQAFDHVIECSLGSLALLLQVGHLVLQ